jgi:hypothetical protein
LRRKRVRRKRVTYWRRSKRIVAGGGSKNSNKQYIAV